MDLSFFNGLHRLSIRNTIALIFHICFVSVLSNTYFIKVI